MVACVSIEPSIPVQGDAEAVAASADLPAGELMTRSTASLPLSKSEKSPETPIDIKSTHASARLTEPLMHEISGFAGSQRYGNLLYAINDSGNPPYLFAIDNSGSLIERWSVDAENRDWEELDNIILNGQNYLVIGDTGDNLQVHKNAKLHLLPEPDIPKTSDLLKPTITITFTYEDGPRNVEAFSTSGQSIYLLSKEPVGPSGRTRSGIYRLRLPNELAELNNEDTFIAERVGTMPLRRSNIESALASSIVDVDLSHPTALSINSTNSAGYILTYREVLHVRRLSDQSWSEALAKPATRLFSHRLRQAEAMSLLNEQALWLTSEGRGSELLSVPLAPP